MSRPRQDSDEATREELTHEYEALMELRNSEGWRYFVTRALREWQGIGYQARVRAAIGSNDLSEVKAVDRTASELLRLLNWPADRVEELSGQTE